MPKILIHLLFTILLLIFVYNPVRPEPDTFLEFVDSIGNVPWLVSLAIAKGGGHFCDGSLIATRWVLTGAHCVRNFDTEDIEVRAGSGHPDKGGQSRRVETMVVHPNWNDVNFNFALLKLNAGFESVVNVDVIKLIGEDDRYAITGQQCVASGWGMMQGRPMGELHGAIIPLVDPNICQANCQEKCKASNILCAGGNGLRTCQGDSGGPLICSGRLAGIASSGRSCGTQYGVFAFVQIARDWIKNVVEN